MDDVNKAREGRLERLVEAALDAGRRYDADVVAHILLGGGLGDDARDLGTPPVDLSGLGHAEATSQERALRARVSAGPRGTWAAFRTHGSWHAVMSDGSGKPSPVSSVREDAPPDYASAYSRMVGYEVYMARRRVEASRQVATDLRAIREHGIRVGERHPGFRVEGHTFSSFKVSEIDGRTGRISVIGTKRGSAKGYAVTLGASYFARQAEIPLAPAEVLGEPPGPGVDVERLTDLAASLVADMTRADPLPEHATGPGMGQERKRWLRSVLGAMGRDLPAGSAPWRPATTRSLAIAYKHARHDRDGIGYAPEARLGLLTIAAVRIADAMARNRPAGIRDAGELAVATRVSILEGGAFDDVLATAATMLAAAPPDVAQGQGLVEHLFTWGRTAGARATPTYSVGSAILETVDPRDAPVACTLAPRGGGQGIDVRVMDGRCLRPVLAPGSWRPVDEAEFRDAAARGVPWGDNPFAPVHPHLPLVDVAEVASPEPARMSRDAFNQREAAKAKLSESVGRLCLVDGIVHRECPAPTVHLVRMPGSGETHVGWSIRGQITSDTAMDSLRPGNASVTAFNPLWEEHWVATPWPFGMATMPLSEAGRLPAVLGPWAGAAATRLDIPASLDGPGALPPAHGHAFTSVADMCALIDPGSQDADVTALAKAAWQASRDVARDGVPDPLPDLDLAGRAWRNGIDGTAAVDCLLALMSWCEEERAFLAERDGPGIEGFVP